jgi:endonuclease/exonuclease/phosphatase (EEP) superfamily protein YafD
MMLCIDASWVSRPSKAARINHTPKSRWYPEFRCVRRPWSPGIRLNAVHPEPAVPYEDTIGRDGELVRVATEVKADPLPAIITGDLHDVAWSRTARRFQRLSGLLDSR